MTSLQYQVACVVPKRIIVLLLSMSLLSLAALLLRLYPINDPVLSPAILLRLCHITDYVLCPVLWLTLCCALPYHQACGVPCPITNRVVCPTLSLTVWCALPYH